MVSFFKAYWKLTALVLVPVSLVIGWWMWSRRRNKKAAATAEKKAA